MATIPDSVKAQLDADWTGAGGAEPTYYVEEDIRTNPPTGEDYVFILSSTLDTDPVPFNDTFVNEKHVLEMVVNTLTSEDRLKELGDEVVRILNATAIADITYQRLKRRKITSGVDKGVFNYQEVITYDLQEQMKSGTAAYGAGSGPSLTQDNIEDLLMWTSVNAAYVPCPIIGHTTWTDARQQFGKLSNTGAGNMIFDILLPIPTNKGSLKLYLKNFQFGSIDADATDFVTSVAILGLSGGSAPATLDTDSTNHISTGTKVFSGAVMPAAVIDVSAYGSIIISFTCTNAGGFQLDLADFLMECYYDT